jgi:hypothetical protein
MHGAENHGLGVICAVVPSTSRKPKHMRVCTGYRCRPASASAFRTDVGVMNEAFVSVTADGQPAIMSDAGAEQVYSLQWK